MFWDDENDSEDYQKLKNITFFKFWGTNKERDELFNSSTFSAIIIIIVVGFLVFAVLSATGIIK